MSSPGETYSSPFPTTHWTLVHTLHAGSAQEKAVAMETLCRGYWYPIYAFLRRSGHAAHDAEDLTQAFFEQLILDESLQAADREQGRLRSFLLGVLRRMMSQHVRHRDAQRRGGRATHVSFDAMEAEERYACEPKDTRDPERVFAQAWAHELLAGVRADLRATIAATGRGETFTVLLPFLMHDDDPPSYRDVATQLGSSEAGARLLIFRARSKFRNLLREKVACTVRDEKEIAAEMAWLISTLSAK